MSARDGVGEGASSDTENRYSFRDIKGDLGWEKQNNGEKVGVDLRVECLFA
jgi:hypothetical protein